MAKKFFSLVLVSVVFAFVGILAVQAENHFVGAWANQTADLEPGDSIIVTFKYHVDVADGKRMSWKVRLMQGNSEISSLKSGQAYSGKKDASRSYYVFEITKSVMLPSTIQSGEYLLEILSSATSSDDVNLMQIPVVVGNGDTDVTPPLIVSLTVDQPVLGPPNHKMVPVNVFAEIEDEDPLATWEIVSITSNETLDVVGAGHEQEIDYVITGPETCELRAERSGKGERRMYTITIEAFDTSGNVSSQSIDVLVAHDRGKAEK